MKYSILTLSALMICTAPYVQAQMLGNQTKPIAEETIEEEPKAVEKEKTDIETVETEDDVTADDIVALVQMRQQAMEEGTISAKELAEMKKPVMESIMQMVDKSTPRERRALLQVMKEMQKMTNRRKNLTLPEDQQLDINEDIDVDVMSKDDFRRYMTEKLVSPTDRVMDVQKSAK